MKTFILPDRTQWLDLLKRPVFNLERLEGDVSDLLSQVQGKGLSAIQELTKRFDGYCPEPLEVSTITIQQASALISPELKEAIEIAARNIEKFHRTQLREPVKIDTAEGIQCWQKDVPIDSVGLYIPGGTAPLFSTVLMLGIPARIAGCKEISLCTPAGKDGEIHPAILYAADTCGIKKIFRIGGVQAIGAMAYGICVIPKADKIFGPGNQYVTMAKQLVSRQGVAIDMPAGPSEVLVIADETCDPTFIATDLISQAEHGKDSQVVVLCTDEEILDAVNEELDKILESLPRAEIARKALDNSHGLVLENLREMVEFSNAYAPEHLILSVSEASVVANKIANAGSVFIGNYSPESAGDYATGTNHTLPTNGYARSYSGLTTQSFMKTIQFQEVKQEGIAALGPHIIEMAQAEGLKGHALAVSVRLNKIRNEKI